MFSWLKRRVLRREVKRILENLEREGQLNFLKAFFGGSKKATAVLGGVLVVIFRQVLGLDEQTAAELVKLLMAYVGAQGLVDVGLAFAGHKEQ